MSYNIFLDIGSSSDSSLESIAYVSSKLSCGGIIKWPLDSSPLSSSLYANLQVSDDKLPSSKCVNVIIFPVCSFEDVAQGIYDIDGCIAIAYEYGRDVYANSLEKLSSKTTSYEDIIFLVLDTYTRYPF